MAPVYAISAKTLSHKLALSKVLELEKCDQPKAGAARSQGAVFGSGQISHWELVTKPILHKASEYLRSKASMIFLGDRLLEKAIAGMLHCDLH